MEGFKIGDLVRYKREHTTKPRLGIVTRDWTHVNNYVLVRWLHQQAEVPEYITHLEVVEDNKNKRREQ